LDLEAAELVDKTVLSVISEGLFDLDSAEAQAISIRRGGSGTLSDRLSVGWVSYTDGIEHFIRAVAGSGEPSLDIAIVSLVIVLCRPRDELYRRIGLRAQQMLDARLIEETATIRMVRGE
jgi:hypothetical protein